MTSMFRLDYSYVFLYSWLFFISWTLYLGPKLCPPKILRWSPRPYPSPPLVHVDDVLTEQFSSRMRGVGGVAVSMELSVCRQWVSLIGFSYNYVFACHCTWQRDGVKRSTTNECHRHASTITSQNERPTGTRTSAYCGTTWYLTLESKDVEQEE